MQLNKDYTHITVEERASSEWTVTEPHVQVSTGFIAHLDGESTDGHHIEMSREGKTPDKAIKALFEAMTEADVIL